MRNIFTILLFSIIFLFGRKAQAQAQLSITSFGTIYSQDFNSLAQSGNSNSQSGGIFDAGWSFVETGTSANPKYTGGTGSSLTGDTYSYGVAGTNPVSDRALGMFVSSALNSIIGFRFTNNTGTTITSITIGYTGEVWRQNFNGDNLTFSYQLGNVALAISTGWTTVAALGFTTPISGTSTISDGNATANRTIIGPVTISDLNIPNGGTVTMRWVDAVPASSAGMGIDDFTISVATSFTPPANDDCMNAITLTPSPSPAVINGTFISARPSIGLTTNPAKNDVWYQFTAPCNGSDSIVVSYTSAAGVDIDFDVFANSCPTSGAGIVTAYTSSNPESKKANYTGGTVYYIRVVDAGSISASSFNISVFMVAPGLSGSIINGASTPCSGNTVTYSVSPPITGVSYIWTLPGTDWTGSSNTNSITTVAGSSAGNITLTAKDGCGMTANPLSKTITPIASPVNVTGVSVNAGNGQLTVSWTNPANCYDELMVVATDNSGVTLAPSGDGLQYVDTVEYASQNKNNGANMNPGEYCIYKGNSSTVVITGLLNSNTYQVRIFTRWGTQWSSGIQVSGTPIAVFNGAYRSVKSGPWTDNTTWNKYDGSTWVATSGSGDYPNNYTSDVIIQSGHIVQLNNNLLGPLPVRDLTVESNAQLWTRDQDATGLKNKYITVFGNIICNGTIGNTNPNTLDNICFNIDGASVKISGTGIFNCTRIRKNFDASTTGVANTTTLDINMNINLLWSGTALYNNATNGTNTSFNVTIQPNYTVTLKNSTGSVAIDGISGDNNNSNSGGKFIINGTLIIPGILYLKTDNIASGVPCRFEIGTTGKVYTNAVNAGSSGAAGHTLVINNGGLLRITDAAGFVNYSSVNNTINLFTGSTVEYAASGNQQVLSGQTYSNLIVSGSGEKLFDNNAATATINGILNINTGNTLALSDKAIYLNGAVGGYGSFTGSASSKLIIGPSGTLTATPLGVLRFTPGSERLNVLTLSRYMDSDKYPNHKYWAAVLGSNLSVDTLNLNQGIIATDKYLLALLSYPINGYSTFNKASYVAITDTLATPFTLINSFDGSYGFRINGVKANTDTYFPVGADFIAPNRVMINLGNGAATRDMTVALTKGDIGYTGSPRVNRIWYIKSSIDDSINASMRLYYTAHDVYTYPYFSTQDELETGFTGTNVRLVEKIALNDHYFTNIANGTDARFNPSNNKEAFGQYTIASAVYNGTHPGIYKFRIFSVVDGNNVVLPVAFRNIRAYQQGTGIMIDWLVANETGIDHYEVERAGDGRLFSVVATQQVHNSRSAGNNYIVVDGHPLAGTNYYRIKAVGRDGQVLYSTIVSITLASDGQAGLLVYPNPITNNKFNVQLTNLAAGTYNISIYNKAGQLIALKQVKHEGGATSLELSLPAGTAAGVYIIRLTGKGVGMQTSVFVSGK